ncbi:MAG TPA: LacI family DNA-binding transcriptional regulator [Thermoanaerobaculaceae bacterium]|nr:LacI family DNA-binding transcriptional regulator [Thermoanaerobaculaceae bacterium]
MAARAGLSIKTVSRVLNLEPNVRPQTRERVLTAASELEYQPNLSARRLASKRSFVIGLLYDNPDSDYVMGIQEGTLAACRPQDYHLLIHPCSTLAPDLVDEALNLHRRSMADGLILTQPVADFQPLTTALTEADIPFVRISQRPCAGESPLISVDDEQAARRLTDHLILLGHSSIGFIMGHPDHGSSHDRLKGFRASLEAHGLSANRAPIEQGLYTFDSGYACAQRLLALKPRPTAIFAGDDHMAMGVLTAAHERGFVVPDDLSVCGFDDTPMARYAWPPLTTARQPIIEVARLATECLLNRLQGKEIETKRYTLESRLVLRGSTGKMPGP